MNQTKMKPLSPIMERHTPQHPLPEEIKKLPQDETVCQFCGVSYLIHHEIKKLEDKVAQLEEELEESLGAVEREQKLRVELDKSKCAIEKTNKLLISKDATIENITKDIDQIKSVNEKLIAQVAAEKLKKNQILQALISYKNQVKSSLDHYKNEAQSLKTELSQIQINVEEINTEAVSAVSSIIAKLPTYVAGYISDFKLIQAKNAQLTMDVASSTSETEYWKNSAAEHEKEISSLKHDLQINKDYNSNKDTELHEKIKELESSNKELASSLRLSEMQVKSVQAESVQIDEKLKKKQSDLQKAIVKMQKTEENANFTIQRLNQDCRQLESELSCAQEELRKLENLHKERERKEREFQKQATLNSGQIEEVKAALAEAKCTNKALMEERELMVSSHQNQIEQLRENFKKKLKASDAVPVHAQKELQLAEERHRAALASLEQSLKDEFHIELSVEKDKHSEAMANLKSKYRSEMKELEVDLQKEIDMHQNQIAKLNQRMVIINSSNQEKEKEWEYEKKSLKKMISDLELRITELTGSQEDEAALKKLEVVAASQKVEETLKKNEELEQDVLTLKEEISLLQDTVRRECEERFELTEALSQAREELKANRVSDVAKSHSITNPVSAVNKLNPTGFDLDPSRLSSRTLRSLEADSSTQRSPNGIPSLRYLPDVPSKRVSSNFNGSSKDANLPHESNNYSPNIKDISFGSVETRLRRSQSNGSYSNGHSLNIPAHNNSGGIKLLSSSKSADSVDTVRRRIAAAIKRK